ncbi:primosomal protein N' [Neisseria lisongii]|uniref:Replication restart protein PriA n=1 Tax=Neisseria lisongii TaxID=2912188 RepID=A0AAW5AK28_9NEIS|nr:primosomal protein N' [Neisseria lisongii]MCF7530257.1 primosomal protein N' [Neisseria lisongii]
MIYHHIALNVPLSDGLLTYVHPEALPVGRRVVVPFRNRPQVGIVWAAGVEPQIAAAKILPIQEVFDDEPLLPPDWQALLSFTARYYHYPLGQAVFTALPHSLKEPKAVALPQPPLFYRLNAIGRQQPAPPARFRKQTALWAALAETAHGVDMADLKRIHAQAEKTVAAWQQQGWIDCTDTVPPHAAAPRHTLNEEQQAAAAEIQTAFGRFQPFLLYGITGSGKTEVYFDAVEKVLASGKQVLFLLPEINLTPQLLKRIGERFGDVPLAVLHSQTAAGKRTQDYLRSLLGQARLIIGTRLAVFTPLPDVGLIVVDEEHDTSFKQDNELRYHARDLAVWRAKQHNCPIVLGSATPSLESWHKAQSGTYRLLELTRRGHAAARPPVVEILNVGRLKMDNGFSPQALKLLQQNHQQGGMSLVYLNRRGFAPALFCGDCGHTFGCPNCSAKMVLHQRAKQLRCHHCDYRQPVPYKCPDCGNQDLTAVGFGTQRVEETLRLAVPNAKVVRVDRDSTAHKNDWAELYRQIAGEEIDILVGTQMLAKGHDFARLNLVIVLNADGSLYSSDFRAPERLFAELMQVSGRAGRADSAGHVLIQTQLPDHPVFAAVKAQDYRRFAEQALLERQPFSMPPFGFQTAIRADAPTFAEAAGFLNEIKAELESLLPENVACFGAVPMLMVRLAERERAQIFLESPSRKDLHRAVSLWVQMLQQNRQPNIRWSVDVDVQEM